MTTNISSTEAIGDIYCDSDHECHRSAIKTVDLMTVIGHVNSLMNSSNWDLLEKEIWAATILQAF